MDYKRNCHFHQKDYILDEYRAMFILWNKGYFSCISAYLPLMNKFFMQPSIKPTVNQSACECFPFKPSLSCLYSLLSPLSQERKKKKQKKNWTSSLTLLLFSVGQYFISQWNRKPLNSGFCIKCKQQQSHTTPKLFQVTIKTAFNSHLAVFTAVHAAALAPAKPNWGNSSSKMQQQSWDRRQHQLSSCPFLWTLRYIQADWMLKK